MASSPAPLKLRAFAADDAAAVASLLEWAFAGRGDAFPAAIAALQRGPAVLAQTGSRFLVAEDNAALVGAVRWWDADGIAWFDLLAADAPGAGRQLVRAVERGAQDAGLRHVRCSVPAGILEDYFGRLGYLPVGRTTAGVTLEKRLPLLTVREQRAADADAIGALLDDDPWRFSTGHRPGWFVLADGERVAGVIGVRDAGAATAQVTELALDEAYRGRGIEVWMLERAATYAATNGFAAIEVPAESRLEALKRDLEDRRWFPEGGVFHRSLAADAELLHARSDPLRD
jgi:ribosomal protein S18 acetylase RimI-like enzyme